MYLGIDIGGTKIAAGIVDDGGRILAEASIPTRRERPYTDVLEETVELCGSLAAGHTRGLIRGAGIGVPGPVDVRRGLVIDCVNLGWKNIPIEEIMGARLGMPVFTGNDATLAGLAELEAGELKGARTGVMLTLGTGIGSAVVCEGRIQYGAHGIDSEIGHMIVGRNDHRCSCGRNGCLETFASATALERYAKKLIDRGEPGILADLCREAGLGEPDGEMIFKVAMSGDATAGKAVDRVVKYLAIGITNIVAVIDPERIVLGGGLSGAGGFLLDKVRNEVERIRFYKELPIGDIVVARFGSEAGVIGAAMLAKQRLKEE